MENLIQNIEFLDHVFPDLRLHLYWQILKYCRSIIKYNIVNYEFYNYKNKK